MGAVVASVYISCLFCNMKLVHLPSLFLAVTDVTVHPEGSFYQSPYRSMQVTCGRVNGSYNGSLGSVAYNGKVSGQDAT